MITPGPAAPSSVDLGLPRLITKGADRGKDPDALFREALELLARKGRNFICVMIDRAYIHVAINWNNPTSMLVSKWKSGADATTMSDSRQLYDLVRHWWPNQSRGLSVVEIVELVIEAVKVQPDSQRPYLADQCHPAFIPDDDLAKWQRNIAYPQIEVLLGLREDYNMNCFIQAARLLVNHRGEQRTEFWIKREGWGDHCSAKVWIKAIQIKEWPHFYQIYLFQSFHRDASAHVVDTYDEMEVVVRDLWRDITADQILDAVIRTAWEMRR